MRTPEDVAMAGLVARLAARVVQLCQAVVGPAR